MADCVTTANTEAHLEAPKVVSARDAACIFRRQDTILLVTSHSCDQAKAAKLNYWRDFRSPVGSSLLAHVVVVHMAVAAAVAAGESRVTATSVALSTHIEEDAISTN
jgi:hypothetical protein